MPDARDQFAADDRRPRAIPHRMARVLRLLPDPARAHEPGSLDSPEIAFGSLAAMAERAQPIYGASPLRHREVRRIGRCRFTDGTLAHVRTPGGSTRPTKSCVRLSWSPPNLHACAGLTRSNRRGTDPYARWCGRGGVARRPPIPILGTKRAFKVLRRRSDVEGRADMARTLPEGDPRYATDFYRERMVQVAHLGAGAPQVHGGLGRAFARNYVRRSSLEYSGLRGEGSIPVPLPPPASRASR